MRLNNRLRKLTVYFLTIAAILSLYACGSSDVNNSSNLSVNNIKLVK